jgi:hypothetical protein
MVNKKGENDAKEERHQRCRRFQTRESGMDRVPNSQADFPVQQNVHDENEYALENFLDLQNILHILRINICSFYLILN